MCVDRQGKRERPNEREQTLVGAKRMQSGKKRERERECGAIEESCEGIRKVKRSGNLKRGREKEKERESLELLPR